MATPSLTPTANPTQALTHLRSRFLAEAQASLDKLVELRDDPDVSPRDQLRAANDILSRVPINPTENQPTPTFDNPALITAIKSLATAFGVTNDLVNQALSKREAEAQALSTADSIPGDFTVTPQPPPSDFDLILEKRRAEREKERSYAN